MSEEQNVLEPKRYKLVPPDGGWGYMIWVAVIIINVSTAAVAPCFGLIYNDFMEDVKMGTTSFTLLNGINGVSFSITGYAAGPLLKTMSQRQVAFLGTTISLIGNIGLFWSYTQSTFFIFQSIMCLAYALKEIVDLHVVANIGSTMRSSKLTASLLIGLHLHSEEADSRMILYVHPGHQEFINGVKILIMNCAGGGFLINVSFTIINNYFFDKRLLSISFTQAVTAFVGMLAPLAITWALDEYGYRGWLMLQAGLTMQCFVAAALMQPAELHLKRVSFTEEDALEEAKLLLSKRKNVRDIMKTEDGENAVVVKITLSPEADQNIVEKSQEKYDDTKKRKGIIKAISETLDLSLFKNFAVLSTNVGLSLCVVADITFTIMLPQALYAMNWSNNAVAWSLTLAAFGDLATRIAVTLLSKPLAELSNKNLYMIGLAVAVTTRLGMLGSESRTAINIYLTLMGISRCTIGTLVPLVLAETVEPSLFAQALGMNMLIFGLGNMVLGPVIGAVRDLTNSYASSFYILTSFFAIVLMFWCIELCYLRNQKKELTQKIKAKKSYKPK